MQRPEEFIGIAIWSIGAGGPHRRNNTKHAVSGLAIFTEPELVWPLPRELRRRSDRGEWSSRCPPRLAGTVLRNRGL